MYSIEYIINLGWKIEIENLFGVLGRTLENLYPEPGMIRSVDCIQRQRLPPCARIKRISRAI